MSFNIIQKAQQKRDEQRVIVVHPFSIAYFYTIKVVLVDIKIW